MCCAIVLAALGRLVKRASLYSLTVSLSHSKPKSYSRPQCLGLVPTPPCYVTAVLFEHLILIRIIKLAFLATQRGGQGQAPFNLAMNCLDRRSRLFWSSATVGCAARCSLRPLPVPGGRRCGMRVTPAIPRRPLSGTGSGREQNSSLRRLRWTVDDTRETMPGYPCLLQQLDRICDAWTTPTCLEIHTPPAMT